MECHACGASVVEGQKFCQECGTSLHGVTEPTQRLVPPAGAAPDPDEPGASEPPVPPVEAAPDALAAAAPSALADLPTVEITPSPPLPDPHWADEPPDATGDDDLDDALAALGAAPIAAPEPPGAGDASNAPPASPAGPDPVAAAAAATTVLGVTAATTDEITPPGTATTVLGTTGTTDEFPAVFDGSSDVYEYPPGREPFRLRLTFLFAFFAAIAALMSSAADVIDIRTSTPIDGIDVGIRTLDDIGVNLSVAGFVGAVVVTLGGLLACFGFRWGAGLAGGTGLALAGWSGLIVGLAEARIAVAEAITRTSTQAFTLTVTRDLGYWLVVSAGVIGLLVFAASLRLAGTGGRRSLNPWVAAVGAVGSVILAAGPLVPEDNASFSDNFRSSAALGDLPAAYFGGRLGQVALIAFAGVVGFLLVRAYGLGLVAGGISVAVWLWLSSLLGIGEELLTGVQPLGIAAGNFGARGGDTTPHGVTTVGMALTLSMLFIATVLAIVQHRRDDVGH